MNRKLCFIKKHYDFNPKIYKANPKMEIYSAYEEIMKDHGKEVFKCKAFPILETIKLIPGTFFNNSISHVFAFIAAQEALGYEAGRSLDDELPLTTFREDELSVVEN